MLVAIDDALYRIETIAIINLIPEKTVWHENRLCTIEHN